MKKTLDKHSLQGYVNSQLKYNFNDRIDFQVTMLDIENSLDRIEYCLKHILGFYNVIIESIDCDLENEDSRNNLIERVIESNVNLDILINNAAFVGGSNLEGWVEEFGKQSVETWNRALEVNLTAPFHLCQAFTPLLRKRKVGSIISIGSIYGLSAPDYSLYKGTSMGNPAGYSASKGGLIQLTKWLSSTIEPDIRVNSISPGGG
jgi:NAD(P)-dependent dehydrogenase (short-subunit alcohol dehydrogenase family)